MKNKKVLKIGSKKYSYYDITSLDEFGISLNPRLPYSLKVLLECALRNFDGKLVTLEHLKRIATWDGKEPKGDVPFIPSRIILQDFTGVPVAVDLAAMRAKIQELGGDPSKINPIIPVDLVIDHSVMVDSYGSSASLDFNVQREFDRNTERYELLKWAQEAFSKFRVFPPSIGIIHQVNLEYLAEVASIRTVDNQESIFPDSLVGTDSHTTMINGIGVLGWGVGGIEAEACMLAQPLYFLLPEVIGIKLTGSLPAGSTSTDLVLTITQLLREEGVVGKFIEFFGDGLSNISVEDRATVSNMCPEYGATAAFFPVDDETLEYLRITGRSDEHISMVEKYYKAQGMFRTEDSPIPQFTKILEFDLSKVQPCIAGPKRPQDRIPLMKQGDRSSVLLEQGDRSSVSLFDGAVVIAAITSCTNTSNPSVMVGAGLLAKKAVELGLEKPWYVKTSFGPGSLVVTEYLEKASLMPYLDRLGFNVVGYGCTTCIGNSGPLDEEVEKTIQDQDLSVAAVLSGNRNFEGRIHPLTKQNYLASPILVVAYALAGRMDIDFQSDPIGFNDKNQPIFLKDIWPKKDEIDKIVRTHVTPDIYINKYKNILTSNQLWNDLSTSKSDTYNWNDKSSYIKLPPFFDDMEVEPSNLKDIEGANILAILGDSVTTDHISPAGSIPETSDAGIHLTAQNISINQFNSYGSRRGTHEVMMRGTFANIRIRNKMTPDIEGGYTRHIPSGKIMSIYKAAMKYKTNSIPLVVIAGKEYGTGSSRDWAAKGTALLGVRAVLAESFERIHRSNLIGMGVLPLQFLKGENAESLGLKGDEMITITGISENLFPNKKLNVSALLANNEKVEFEVLARLDNKVEIEYYQHGGILNMVLRSFLKNQS